MEEAVRWIAALTELNVIGVAYMWDENWNMWIEYEK